MRQSLKILLVHGGGAHAVVRPEEQVEAVRRRRWRRQLSQAEEAAEGIGFVR